MLRKRLPEFPAGLPFLTELLDAKKMTTLKEYIHHAWEGETLDAMKAFIRIPSKSSAFDAEWEKHGFLLEAVKDAAQWGKKRFPSGTFEILSKPGVTPALFIDLPASDGHTGRPVFFTDTSTSSLKPTAGLKDSARGCRS